MLLTVLAVEPLHLTVFGAGLLARRTRHGLVGFMLTPLYSLLCVRVYVQQPRQPEIEFYRAHSPLQATTIGQTNPARVGLADNQLLWSFNLVGYSLVN